MKLTTMTNLFYSNTPDGEGYLRAMRRTHEVGFDGQDFCMCPMQRGETELNSDDWEAKLERLCAEREALGIDMVQSHLLYPKAAMRRKYATDEGCELNEYFMKMNERAVRISGALGVKWAVVHPVDAVREGVYDTRGQVEYNHRVYDPIVKLANELGVGIAFENMCDVDGYRRFGAAAEDLMAIVSSYDGAKVGICWDFGHAHRALKDAEPSLRMVAPYLRATHVDDNRGTDDLHILPFHGTINWGRMMTVLREIGYGGAFNFELSICRRMPEELVEDTVRYAYRVGRYLLSM